MPRTIGGKSGLVGSGITIPTVPDLAVLRPRAIGFGRYPSCSATLITRRAVSALTRPRVAGLSARDAVAAWTPAATATSRSVGAGTAGILGASTTWVGRVPAAADSSGREPERYGEGRAGGEQHAVPTLVG